MRTLILACILFAGCNEQAYPPRQYVVRIYRPDGALHREYRGKSTKRPTIWNMDGGAAWTRLDGQIIDAANGWQLEVDMEAEAR